MSYQLVEARIAAARGDADKASQLEGDFQNFWTNFESFSSGFAAASRHLQRLQTELHEQQNEIGKPYTPDFLKL